MEEQVKHLKPGDLLLLENLRFHRGEEHPEEDPAFAKALARLGELYVNDAFATAHRKHSSTYTLATYFPGSAAAGFLLEKEIEFLADLLHHPKPPFYALIGGAKISTKLGVIESLLKKVDQLLIGGGMAYTFLLAKKIPIGHSLVEKDRVEEAASLLKEHSDKIVLPIDCVAATQCDERSPTQIIHFDSGGIPSEYAGFDIGPATIALFKQILSRGKTILWNGPMGVYEKELFAQGTNSLAKAVATLSATVVIGGGDLIAAVKKSGVADAITHISSGGGATLEYLEYGTLPGIEALSDKK